ncbi:MAG: S1 RNA-binding domain-containing protein [Planctomycetota bacterium]|nr:S1 RNA-binding domain-containing protein [Planctomycetota bacterium]
MIKVDDIIEGTVTIAESFGAYVDCDGIQFLIPLHELSWIPLVAATDVVNIGDRISLIVDRPPSMSKQFAGPLGSVRRMHPEKHPWHDPSVYSVGTVFMGVVYNPLSYGVFIRHPLQALALLHFEDFDPTTKTLCQGDTVEVVITHLNVEEQDIRVRLK